MGVSVSGASAGFSFQSRVSAKSASQSKVIATPVASQTANAAKVPSASFAPIIASPALSMANIIVPTAGRLDEKSAAQIWYQIRALTSADGLNGRRETLSSPLTTATAQADQLDMAIGDYKGQVEARMKAQGWWDEESGQPALDKSYFEKKYDLSKPEEARAMMASQPAMFLSWNMNPLAQKMTAIEAKAAWLADPRNRDKIVETVAPAVSARSYQTRTISAGDVQAIIDSGGIQAAARVFASRLTEGALSHAPFSGTWGDRKTASAAEYSSWLNEAAGISFSV